MRSVLVRIFFARLSAQAGFGKIGGGCDGCVLARVWPVNWGTERSRRRALLVAGLLGLKQFGIVLASLWLCLLRHPQQFFCAKIISETLALRGGEDFGMHSTIGLTSKMGLR